MIKLASLLSEDTLRTVKGSGIRRYKGQVGKLVGRQLYVHKDYAGEVIPTDLLEWAEEQIKRFDPRFNYNTVMMDTARDELRFDEAPDFDAAREPHVGDFIKIDLKGAKPPYKGYSNSIWHHKWMWVRDDYKGFDVDKSKEWSKIWLGKLQEPAKGTDASWGQQLGKYGLKEGEGGELTGKEKSFLQKWILSSVEKDEKGNPIVHRIWFKNVLNPFLRKMGWVIATKVDDKGNVVGYSVRKFKGYVNEGRGDPGDHVVFGGIWSQGKIVANIINKPDLGDTAYGHTRDMGPMKWVYYQESEVIFWNLAPADWQKNDVVKWLNHRGYNVKGHRMYDDYYDFMKSFYGKKGEDDVIAEADMNGTKEEAALDFLMKMVKSGPFAGKVYLAGGAVRDMELGKTPKDLDVTVVGDGLKGGLNFTVWLAKQMGNYKGPFDPPPARKNHITYDEYGKPFFTPYTNDPAFLTAIEQYDKYYASYSNPVIFPKFGTANVNLTGVHNGVSLDGVQVQAVAARKEIYTPGSRKPKVSPGSLKDDVFRRDFRANSLIMDLTTGQVLDLTGHGKEDIKAGIIKTTSEPEIIFKEDPLRMMRAVRFMVQKGWKIDPETEASIRKNAAWLKWISGERIQDELGKILVAGNADAGIRKLSELGLLQYIGPELQQMVGMTQNVHHTHDVFDHTLQVLKNTKPELVQRLMALFHDIGKVATRSETPTGVHFYGHEDVGVEIVDRIMRKLKYPLEIIDAVKMGVSNHMRLKQGGDDAVKLSDKALRKLKIDLGNNLEHILDVIHADNIAHADASVMPNQIEKVRQRLKALDIQVKKPELPINGNDLIDMGIKPGPQIGAILSAVTDAWFGNPNLTREEALAIAKGML